jgi:hypothetical protein
MGQERRRTCGSCGGIFTPDPRNTRHHQRYGGKARLSGGQQVRQPGQVVGQAGQSQLPAGSGPGRLRGLAQARRDRLALDLIAYAPGCSIRS